MAAEFFTGAPIVIRLPGIAQPEISPVGNGYIYFDSGSGLFMASQNGGAYVPLVGGGGGGNLASTLLLGNTTGASDIVVSTGQAVRGAAELTLASAVGSDLVLTGRGAATNLNQVGETSLDVIYTGVGRTSIIGALNALVDGTIAPGAPSLSAVLAVGNTTGAFSISVNGGQKIVSAAASALTLDGTTTLDLQSGATTRWQVTSLGHLVPGATDNTEDIGASAVNRIRTLYAGTSVVVGATVTIDGIANTIVGSTGLALSATTGAASLAAIAGAVSVTGGTTAAMTGATGLTLSAASGAASLAATAGAVSVTGSTTATMSGANGLLLSSSTGAASLTAATSILLSSGTSVSMVAGTGLSLVAAGGAAVLSASTGVTLTAGGGNLIADSSGIIDLRIGGASFWQVSAIGDFVASADATSSIGAAGANRPLNVHVSNSVVIGAALTATGTALTATGALSVAAGAAADLSLSALGAATNLNQAGETSLDAAYVGAGRASIIGALNALVDGAVVPNASALSAVLVAGNTTGANNIVVSAGQKIVSPVATELTLDGTTTLNLQTGGTTRWQVQAAPGPLVPQADNLIDIGIAATNRIRTLYAGTSVVVGATVTIDGTTNTISSSANLTLDTVAAGTMNLGATNAATINLGAGVGATTIFAAANVTIAGDLTVNGTTTTVNSTNLTVTDPLIYANNGGADPSFAGLAWDQGAALDVIMNWNPTNTRMEFGRFNTVGGTTVPSGPLTTLIDARISNLSLAGSTITADAGLSVTATGSNLNLAATGANEINLLTGGSARWIVTSGGNLVGAAADTYDIGDLAAAGRPRRIYVGTEVVVGSTVTIGTASVTGSGALAVTATGATLALAATGANTIALSTAGSARLTVAADGGLGYEGLGADPLVGGVAEGKLYYNSASQELRLSANGGAYVALATATSVGLQQAYNNGETIVTTTADGAIEFTGSNANGDNVLEVSKTPAGAQSGVGILVTMNVNATGNGLTVNHAGSGLAALFSGATISCPGAGANSERFGTGAVAAGATAVAVGSSSSAAALNSVAVGASASVNATGGGVAIGRSATIGAGATQCVVIGALATTTTFANTTVVGDGATGAAIGVVAVGLNAIASASSAVAVGNSANVNATGSGVAVGASATVGAGATSAVAIGASASATTGAGATAIGASATAATTSVAFGRSANSTGGASVAVGDSSVATGTGSIAVGSATSVPSDGAVAVGQGAAATAIDAIAIGRLASAAAIDSVSIGESSSISATGSGVAVGRGAVIGAAATLCVVIGAGATTSIFADTVVVGDGSSATGNGAIACGRTATAATAGIAIGVSATAGASAVACGWSSSAMASSIALGREAATTASNQLVAGSPSTPITTVIFGEGDTDGSPPASVALRVTDATAASAAAGSAFSIRAGNGDGVGAGGTVTLAGGSSSAGTGGEALIQTGNAVLATRLRVLPTGLVGVGSATPLSTLDVQGSFGFAVTSIAASTSANATATVWLVDATAGAVTLTLPTAASALRRTYHVKKTDSSLNTVTIDGDAAETIDGSATQTLIAQFESIMIVSNGTSWFIL